jgi:hypothetical protein
MKCLQEKYFSKLERKLLGLDGDGSYNLRGVLLGLIWIVPKSSRRAPNVLW